MSDNFVALDSDFFGDGDTDASTTPLSTYKENRLDWNTRHLVKHAVNASWTYDEDPTDPWVVGSYYWTVRFLQNILLYPHDKTVRVYLNGTVEYDGLGVGEVEVRASVSTTADSQVGEVAITPPKSWAEGAGPHFIDLEINNSSFLTPTSCMIKVEVRTLTVGDEVAGADVNQLTWGAQFPGGTLREEFGTGETLGPFDGTTYVRLNGSNLGYDGHYDVLSRRYVEDGKDGYWWLGLNVVDFEPMGNMSFDRGTVKMLQIAYLKQYGWHLEVFSDPDKASGSYSPYLAGEKRAQVPVLGQHVSKHGLNNDFYYRRSKIVAMGPTQGGRYNASWPSNRKGKWKFARAEPLAEESKTPLDSIGFSVSAPSARVRVQGFLFGVDVNSVCWEIIDGHVVVGYPGAALATTTVDKDIHHMNINWPMRAKVYQRGPSSWVEKATNSFKPEVRFHQTSPSYNRPMLRQLYFAFHDDVYTDVDTMSIRTAFAGSANATEKSGVLFDYESGDGFSANFRRKKDFTYLTPFVVELELPAGSFDPDTPLRLDIDALFPKKFDDFSGANDYNVAPVVPERVFLGLHSYNITTEPL